jgi:hypothetical protein
MKPAALSVLGAAAVSAYALPADKALEPVVLNTRGWDDAWDMIKGGIDDAKNKLDWGATGEFTMENTFIDQVMFDK